MEFRNGFRRSVERDVREPTRRKVIQSMMVGLSTLFSNGAAADSTSTGRTNPGKTWAGYSAPKDAGFRSAGLDALGQTLFTKPTTSLLIVKGGKIAYSYGDIIHVSYLASARKSVLSMLYGNYVAKGTIDLNKSVGDPGISEAGEGLR